MSNASPSTSERRAQDAGGLTIWLTAGCILLVVVLGWAPHLPSSLWLDETFSYWVIRDGFQVAMERSISHQPEPGYYALLWCWTALAGTSETALRLLSLIAMLGACIGLARLGEALFEDRELGLFAALVLATSWNAYREAVDARPYALGLAALIWCCLALHAWLVRGRWRDALAAGALAAYLPHVHLFFAMAFPALAYYAWLRWPAAGERRAEWQRQLAAVFALLAIGGLLSLPVLMRFMGHAGSLSWVKPPSFADLVSAYVWVQPVAGLLVGMCAVAFSRSPEGSTARARLPALSPGLAAMLGLWLLLPLALLFGVSRLGDTQVFIGRYLIPAIPALALLYACALRAIPSGTARCTAAVVVTLAAFAVHERPADDFRGAVAAVNAFSAGDAEVPVLLATGAIEAQDEGLLRDPARRDYFAAPTLYYPVEARVVSLPRQLRGEAWEREIIEPAVSGQERFAVIEWRGNGADVLDWLAASAQRAGFSVRAESFGNVRVGYFERAAAAGAPAGVER